MNSWAFTGNLGQDCKVEQTQGGTTVCRFTVAVQSGYGDRQKTTWVTCDIFGKKAESALTGYLVSGQKVAITGELTLDQWQNSQGEQKTALKVNVTTIDLIGQKQAGQAPQGGYSQTGQQPQQRPQQPQQRPVQQAQQPVQGGGFDNFDDDIPFANPYQFIYNVL